MNDLPVLTDGYSPMVKFGFLIFNPIPGMEQNSSFFQQSSRLGMSHSDLLYYVVENSCLRQKVNFRTFKAKTKRKKPVSVIFGGRHPNGGITYDRNECLAEIAQIGYYNPKPYLLDFENNVWELPYAFILNHTVEEIIGNAKNARINLKIQKT